jgi:hypothetical protein
MNHQFNRAALPIGVLADVRPQRHQVISRAKAWFHDQPSSTVKNAIIFY